MNLHVHSAHRQRKSLGCEHKKRWRITRADIRPGVYGPLGGERKSSRRSEEGLLFVDEEQRVWPV